MVASCAALFFLAVFYEALKYKRDEMLRRQAAAASQLETIRMPSSNGATEVTTVANPRSIWNRHHFLQTILHGIQVVLGYMLMLAFMTYNVWLALAITLGAMVGYFIFGSRKLVVVDVSEHCH